MKILFVGDPHLNSSNPISRADNYREVTLDKLNQIKDICIKNDISKVITTGDVFSMLDQSLIYMNQVIDILNGFKQKGIEVLTIIGNHDLPRDNLQLIKNSPVYTLIRSGLITWIAEEGFSNPIHLNEDWVLYGLDYSQKDLINNIELIEDKKRILVMHYGTDNSVPADNIPRKELANFKIVVSGHDHHFFPITKEKDTIILRPGSLTRTTREQYNLERDIIVYEVSLEDPVKVVPHKLDIKLPQQAFKSEVFSSADYIDFYSSSYGDLFEEEYFGSESSSLKNIIEELPITVFEENKEYLKKELVKEDFPKI